MLIEESLWIQKTILGFPVSEMSPLLNIGSSTAEFRQNIQPYIHENIFAPIEKVGGQVSHLDIKADEGVDIVGDLTEAGFQQKLIQDYHFSCFLCSNLLEHIEDKNRAQLCQIIEKIMPQGSYLIVTVPHMYPYHKDPIDTMFRPDIQALAALFPSLSFVAGDIVQTPNNMFSYFQGKPRAFFAYIAHITLPFLFKRSFFDWQQQVKYLPFWFKRFDSTCIILKK